MSTLTREVQFEPAYDKRNADPFKNYGIHSVTMRCFVKQGNKAVQFVLYTGWNLPHVEAELKQTVGLRGVTRPFPVDLGYHSPYPMYEDQEPIEEHCEQTGGKCYYDGSGLNAGPVFERLLVEGSAGLWAALEDYWHLVFDKDVSA